MAKRGPKPGRSPMSYSTEGYTTYYQQERIKCGKPNCKCASGEGHGPYWYAYGWDPHSYRMTKKYIGKNPPADIDLGHQVVATMPAEEGQHILEGVYPSLDNPE